jgi:hypothetical protein
MIEYLKKRPNRPGYDFDQEVLFLLTNQEKLDCINDFIQSNFYDFLSISYIDQSFLFYNKNKQVVEAILFLFDSPKLQFCNPKLDKLERSQFEVMSEDILSMWSGSIKDINIIF